MSKPPPTPPHSDIDGVHEDEAPSVASANRAGQTAADLERAAKEARGRPNYEPERSKDERGD